MTTRKIDSIGVGIDTARYGHHVSFLDQEKRTAAKSFHFTENANGYARLEKTLQKMCDKHPGVRLLIRIDAAGQYAENLLQWLHQLPMETSISVGQPARNKAYRKVHFDKRKADPVESLACARFAVVERPKPTPHNPAEFAQLRDVVALMEASSKQRTRLVNQLHGLLARSFPEFATLTGDIAAAWSLKLLAKYPTCQKIAAARLDSLLKIPHVDHDKAVRVQNAAKTSTGSAVGPVIEKLIQQKVRAIQNEISEAKQLEKLAQSAFDALPAGPHKRILTISGIGLQTASALIAKIVSIDRFKTASALIGYFAVFPEEVDVSGTDKSGKPKQGTETRMSRKGNDLVRRLLYTAAQCASKHNPAVKALFARQMAAGKEYNVAMGHCMAKLLRQVFGVWKSDQDFDPNYETRSAEPTAGERITTESVQKKSRGSQESGGKTAQESDHHDRTHRNESQEPVSIPSDQAPSASPSHRPAPADEADATARWKGRPHSAEPEPRSAPT